MNLSKVNRVEVVNHTQGGEGREYVFWKEEAEVELSMQDDERTLKVLIRDKK